jgi:isopentenyl diphosphate isomerase/L-lactate dehydrogenase-like FMN-dependent dehydrogenase
MGNTSLVPALFSERQVRTEKTAVAKTPYVNFVIALYRSVNLWLMRRAAQAGYEALVLTLDTQMIGKRRCNLRNPLKLASSMT